VRTGFAYRISASPACRPAYTFPDCHIWEPLTAQKWKRPDLPEAQKGWGAYWGVAFLIASILLSAGGIAAGKPFMAAIGTGLSGFGILAFIVSRILTEIRRTALEAADDPYEACIAREQANAELTETG
jgi:hypothetical protein